jgi:hypothetical protein
MLCKYRAVIPILRIVAIVKDNKIDFIDLKQYCEFKFLSIEL